MRTSDQSDFNFMAFSFVQNKSTKRSTLEKHVQTRSRQISTSIIHFHNPMMHPFVFVVASCTPISYRIPHLVCVNQNRFHQTRQTLKYIQIPPRKLYNIDTTNDGFLNKVPPFKYGYFWYPYKFSGVYHFLAVVWVFCHPPCNEPIYPSFATSDLGFLGSTPRTTPYLSYKSYTLSPPKKKEKNHHLTLYQKKKYHTLPK